MDLKTINENGISKKVDLDKYGLTSFSLKIIAIICMACDHIAVILFSGDNYNTLYLILRSIGRISFPLFCFVLVEGFFHTSNKWKHVIVMGIFAIISEIPFDLMFGSVFYLKHQNVMFTLLIGFIVIWILQNISMFKVRYPQFLLKRIGIGRLNGITQFIVVLIGMLAAYAFNTDYSSVGVLLIMCFYTFHNRHIGRFISNVVFNVAMIEFGIQCFGTLSTIPIALYNGKKGKYKMKYLFYAFYPMHLLVLFLIKSIIS